MSATHQSPVLLDQAGAAEILGLSPRTLESWRVTGTGPRFVRLGRRAIRYRRAELERWISEQEVNSTSQRGGSR